MNLATHEEIGDILKTFCDNYNQNKRLQQMNRDWHRTVLIQAEDVESAYTLIVAGETLSVQPGVPDNPDIKVISGSETLADLFCGDITPTEPYMNGTLKIFGSEEDVVRLDIISLLIWGG